MEKFTLEFTEKEINLILGALGQMPYVQVYELINNIQKQGEESIKEVERKERVFEDRSYEAKDSL